MITEFVSPPKFVRAAVKAAKENANHENYKLAALIVQKNKVISVGLNYQHKTHPMIKIVNQHKTIHAELNAIIRTVNKDLLKGSTVVVYREDKFGKPAMSRPCVTCQYFLNQYGIKKMVYTNEKGTWVEEILPEYNFKEFFDKCLKVVAMHKGAYQDKKVNMKMTNEFLEVKSSTNEIIFQCYGRNVSQVSQQRFDYAEVFSHVMDLA